MQDSSRDSKFSVWLNARYPWRQTMQAHMTRYYVPKNLNFWYLFGVFSFLVLINQIVTGIWMAMYYTPTAADAFASVEHVMRDVRYGWLLRYLHSTGASAFFVVIYLHMYRAIMYGSFKKPRELLWLIGMVLFVLLMVEAATGYALPWGQLSYWAIKVIVSVFHAIPVIGKDIAIWIQGDYNVSGITLHRFFTFHVIAIPLVLCAMVFIHIVALHKVGSNNPDGIEIKANRNDQGVPCDGIPFHPFYTVKDLVGVIVFLIIFLAIVFYAPTMHGYFLEYPNFQAANPLVTPAHIAPPWYLAPFYSVLRAVPHKLSGIVLVAASIALLFVLPWLDKSQVKSIRYRGIWSKVALCVFVICFAGLGVLGTMALSEAALWFARLFTLGYFLFFILMPFYTRYEKTKPEPTRVRFHEHHH